MLHETAANPGTDAEGSNLSSTGTERPAEEGPKKNAKGWRFWAIFFVLALTSLLTSLEATITSTVLPVIVRDLGGGGNYIWVANGYFLTM